MMRGTNHFMSFDAACRYYQEYGLEPGDVQGKILDGDIQIGEPRLPDHARLMLHPGEGRYFIEE